MEKFDLSNEEMWRTVPENERPEKYQSEQYKKDIALFKRLEEAGINPITGNDLDYVYEGVSWANDPYGI